MNTQDSIDSPMDWESRPQTASGNAPKENELKRQIIIWNGAVECDRCGELTASAEYPHCAKCHSELWSQRRV